MEWKRETESPAGRGSKEGNGQQEGKPLHNPLPTPARIRRGRMEFGIESDGGEFDLDVPGDDEFDV